jgi:Tol biopolymer transport system component
LNERAEAPIFVTIRSTAASILAFAFVALSGSGASGPRTLVSIRGQIGAFAQDGSRIAWLSSTPRCRGLVQLLNLATGKQSALPTKRGATCRNWIRKDVSPMLALAGRRAVWGLYQRSLSHRLLSVVAGGIGRRDRIVEELESECDDCRGAPALWTAGDGPTLLYLGFGITRVLGARIAKVPHAHPMVAFLSLAGTSVAYPRYLGSDYSADARWSPTGAKLAFTSGRDFGNPSLYVVRPTGKGLVNLTGSSEADTPAWSPDGAAIAYVTPARTGWALWRIDPSTRARRKLASNVVAGFRPEWSPNGYTLAFTRPEASGYQIYTVGADGRGERLVTAGNNPQWSPDGSRLVFNSSQGVSVATSDGTGKALLAAEGHTPSFSPDGTRIAFERGADIWVMNADGGNQSRLTDDHDARFHGGRRPTRGSASSVASHDSPTSSMPMAAGSAGSRQSLRKATSTGLRTPRGSFSPPRAASM